MDKNAIGDQGENCACLRLGMFSLFRCYNIGGKAPAFDILIEIIDNKRPYQAFVQVKTTLNSSPYDTKGNLKTSVPKKKLLDLISRPLPTYVAGLDLSNEIMHVAPAFDRSILFPTIPPTIVLSLADKKRSEFDLLRLKEDIINYWEGHNMHINKPAYKSTL